MDDKDSLHSTDNSSSESDMDDQDSLHSTDSSSESDMEFQPRLRLFAASPIFEAIFNENIEDIKDCLRGVDAGSGHIGSLFGRPFNINDALYWACYYGRVRSVKCLLAEGADPEKKPIHFLSDYPIHGACYGGLQVLAALMFQVRLNRGGGTYSRDSVSPFLDAREHRYDSTALHLATRLENEQVVRHLLQSGANPCLVDIAGKFPIEHTKAGTPIFERLWGFMNMFKSYKEDQKKDKLHKSPGGMEDGPAAGSPHGNW